MHPNLLIISNNCLSNTDSNGRTLQNFLIGWPTEHIAQFYIQNKISDSVICSNYYRITDRQALEAFLGRNKPYRKIEECTSSVENSSRQEVPSRNAITMLARNFIWNSNRWWTSSFDDWLDSFNPQIILLQAGDCSFMLRLAECISRKFDAPLVIYNSESYYFKDSDYFGSSGIKHWFYPLFIKQFRRQFKRTLPNATISIYACDKLKKAYDDEFNSPSDVVYTATSLSPNHLIEEHTAFTVSYLGNLGIGRHVPLIEIANALQRISPDIYLNIYGKTNNDEVIRLFDNCRGIKYHGFVSYEKVIEVMNSSDLLVHAENFSDFYTKDLEFAFSTKIADSLAVGTSFLLYAPKNLACSQYLNENKAAFVVSDYQSLEATLRTIICNAEERSKYSLSAKKLVETNHQSKKCAEKFQNILLKANHSHNENSAN